MITKKDKVFFAILTILLSIESVLPNLNVSGEKEWEWNSSPYSLCILIPLIMYTAYFILFTQKCKSGNKKCAESWHPDIYRAIIVLTALLFAIYYFVTNMSMTSKIYSCIVLGISIFGALFTHFNNPGI